MGAGDWECGLVASHPQCTADLHGASRYLHFIPEAILRRLLRWGLSGGDIRQDKSLGLQLDKSPLFCLVESRQNKDIS